jgi:hypothetical protein
MISTYTDLKASVARYLARTDLTDQIPDFIRFAENRLRRDVRIRQMLKVVTTDTVAGDSTVELPSDFLELRDFVVVSNPIQPLNYESPSAFSREQKTTQSGVPELYTVLASEFQLAPVPDYAYPLKMLYFAAPEYLSDTVPTNVWMQTMSDALLYGALLEAESYLMNDPRVGTWGTLFDRAVNSVERSDERSQYSGVPLVIKTLR